jgi:hypothetical protein
MTYIQIIRIIAYQLHDHDCMLLSPLKRKLNESWQSPIIKGEISRPSTPTSSVN